MNFSRYAASGLALAVVLSTVASTPLMAPGRLGRAIVGEAAAPAGGRTPLMVFGGRDAEQLRSGIGAKLDATLAELERAAVRLQPGLAPHEVQALNPAARFRIDPRTGTAFVAVDAVTLGDAQQLRRALEALGLRHAAVYRNDVGGFLPLTSIRAATGLGELHAMRAALSRTHTGAVTSQGDFVQGTATVRNANALDGTGVTVGILSDSYDCYAVYRQTGTVPPNGQQGYASNGITTDAAGDIATGDLPAQGSINVLEEAGAGSAQGTCQDFGAPLLLPYADEGRAMMQIVHDVAPGAKLGFHTAVESEADFANGIQALATAGAKVIADDVTYFDEPVYQDGLLAQAADTVNGAGVAYFSAAGNSGNNAYDNTAPSFATPSSSPAGELLLNFDTSNASTATSLPVNIPALQPGEFIAFVLQWDQPYVTGAPGSGGATSTLDLCVTGSSSGLIASPASTNSVTNLGNNVQVCTGPNAVGKDPNQIIVVGNPANANNGGACTAPLTGSNCTAAQNITVQVGLTGGTTAPGRLKLAVDDNGAGATITAFATQGGTLRGHPGAAGAMAVGAAFYDRTPACGVSPAQLDPYSATGGDPILFDKNGARLASPIVRQKPDIVGPDGGNDTFLGQLIGAGGSGNCANVARFPNFFGTSAATPHVAGAAALFLQRSPGLAPLTLYQSLRNTATPVTNSASATNYTGGYGFIKADAALAALPPVPTVTLSVSPTTITVGQSSTLTWSTSNATTCTASGAWSGNQNLSGSMAVQPAAAGSVSYTLTCTNANGSTQATTVLTVNAPPSSGGGGGGALDWAALLALGSLALHRTRRR
ncbi:MAG: S8 family serine peptidase [Gammaproteobacteria bacterium]|nr:S8 family serine peptidase [Gammaproteobacteria bacterium]